MIEKINDLLAEVGTLTANDEKELEALRIKYLSKKGVMNELMTAFRDVPGDQKRELGQKLNTLKNALQDKINGLRLALSTKDNNHDDLDLTRTPYPIKVGTRHPLSIVKSEIIDIFSRLGFSLADGPEIEDDWHVFSSMNFPEDHPARDMQDTFFVEQHPDIVLRTHTSSIQSRVMETTEPPIRVICPGRVYSTPMPKAYPLYFLLSMPLASSTLGSTMPQPRISTHPVCLQNAHSHAKCLEQKRKSVFAPLTSRLQSQAQKWIFPAISAAGRAAHSVSKQDG